MRACACVRARAYVRERAHMCVLHKLPLVDPKGFAFFELDERLKVLVLLPALRLPDRDDPEDELGFSSVIIDSNSGQFTKLKRKLVSYKHN